MSALNVYDIKELILISCDERVSDICLSLVPPKNVEYIVLTFPIGYYKYDRFAGRIFGPTEAEIIGHVVRSIRKNGTISKSYTTDTVDEILTDVDRRWPGVVKELNTELRRIAAGKLRVALNSSKPMRYEPATQVDINYPDFLAKYVGIPMGKDSARKLSSDCCGAIDNFPVTLKEQIDDLVKEAVKKEMKKSLSISFQRMNGKSRFVDAWLEYAAKNLNPHQTNYKVFTFDTSKLSEKDKANIKSKEIKNMKREFIREERPQTFENIERHDYYYPSIFTLDKLEPTDVFIKIDDELRTVYMLVESENELKSKKTVLNIYTGKLEKMENDTKVHLFDIDEVKFVIGRFVTDPKKAENEEI